MSNLQAQSYRVRIRRKLPPMGIAAPRDFIAVRAQQRTIALADRTWTPYALNAAFTRLTAVKTPPQVDLTDAPFLFRTQYEQAQQTASFALDDVITSTKSLPDPPQIAFIVGTGRSGSTLMIRALHSLPQTVTFSEPDILTQIVRWHLAQPEQAAQQIKVVRALLRWFYAPYAGQHLVVKCRGLVTAILHLLHAAFPQARSVFQYRGAHDWLRSNYRIVTRFAWMPHAPLRWLLRRWYRPYMPALQRPESDQQPLIALAAAIWGDHLAQYAGHYRAGLHVAALHYDDLITQPKAFVQAICDFMGLPAANDKTLDAVFERDSQAESPFARDRVSKKGLSSKQHRVFDDALAALPLSDVHYPSLKGQLMPAYR